MTVGSVQSRVSQVDLSGSVQRTCLLLSCHQIWIQVLLQLGLGLSNKSLVVGVLVLEHLILPHQITKDLGLAFKASLQVLVLSSPLLLRRFDSLLNVSRGVLSESWVALLYLFHHFPAGVHLLLEGFNELEALVSVSGFDQEVSLLLKGLKKFLGEVSPIPQSFLHVL